MTGEADETDEGIRRALDAAQAANDAAQDMAELSAAHRAFAEAVMQGQRRNTMLAAGAAVGAAVALVLGGLVYFRSVADLRDAAAVQADAAKLLVEELKLIDGIGDTVAEQQAVMKTDLLETLETVKDEVRRAAMSAAAPEPAMPAAEMEAQIATAIRDGVKADMETMRDEILTALAGAGVETLPIWIFENLARPNQAPVVNVVATMLILAAIIPVWLTNRIAGDAAGGGRL